MKTQLFKWMLLFVAFMAPLATNAQEELTVYDGTVTTNCVPAYTFYWDDFTRSQFVIPASDLEEMIGGTITSLTFYTTSNNIPYTSVSTADVYMKEVDYTTISAYEPKQDVLYSGTFEFVSAGDGGTVTIEFSTPYVYGGGNLLIAIENTTDAGYKSIYFYGQTVTGASISASNASSLASVTPTQRNFIPKTTFTYMPNGGDPICSKPSGLSVIPTTTTATFSWAATETALNYEWLYTETGIDPDWNNATTTTSTSVEIAGLQSSTSYVAYVRSICDFGTSSVSSFPFSTLEACPDDLVCVGAGEATNTYFPTYTYYNYSMTEQIYTTAELGASGYISSVDFYSSKVVTRNLDIYMVSTEKNSFDSVYDWIPATEADLVFSGEVIFGANGWTTIDFDNSFAYDGVNNVVLIVDDNTGSYETTSQFRVFEAENQAIRIYSDNTNYSVTNLNSYQGTLSSLKNRVRFAIGEAAICGKPTNVSINYTNGLTAEVSWNGDAIAYNIDVNGTVTENVTSPYTLTGLELATNYSVRLQSVCEGDYSAWTTPVNFTTDYCLPEYQCEFTIKLTDSHGDGWDGNTLSVVDVVSNEVLATYTLTSGSEETFTLSVCEDRQYSFVYSGSSYSTENGWLITNSNGDVIAEHEGCSSGCSVASGEIAITNGCTLSPCQRPYNFTGMVRATNAEIHWSDNGTSTAWVVAYKISGSEEDYTLVNVNEPMVILTGLTPETQYSFGVRGADCENIWSTSVSFTTSAMCTAPGNISFKPGTTDAEISWTEYGGSTAWVVAYKITESEDDYTLVNVNEPTITLTGLTPETQYSIKVRGADCEDTWSTEKNFTTKGICDVPEVVTPIIVSATTANLTWSGVQESYSIRYRSVAASDDPDAPATVILTAGDIWGDSTGYQMLLDPTATAYGSIIPTSGSLTSSGDVSEEIYASFEYKIPTNADGALNTENIILNNSVSIQIPAGTYDWCITNPTPGDRMWIAAANGSAGGRADDFVFEPGVIYEFTIMYNGANDGVNLTYNFPGDDWTVIEGVTSPFLLTGLTGGTLYQWQVQGVNDACGDGVTDWCEAQLLQTDVEMVERPITETVCDQYELRNSLDELVQTYTESGIYENMYEDPNLGIMVHATLDLTIGHKEHSYTELSYCGPYTWEKTGQTYNKSGMKFYKGTTPEGCQIRDTLVLTVVDRWSSYTEVTNCGPYTWSLTGQTYNKSGMKFNKGTAADGCPIRDTLVLTVVDRWSSYTQVTNCGPYTWEKTGSTYNKSGLKFYKGTAADGCPIRDTLELTVVDKWSSYTELTNCGPYTWDKTGTTYNKSGMKFYKGTAADGCPIRDTLMLTITDRIHSYTEVTNCGPYTWDKTGTTYNKSGMKFNKSTTAGCEVRDTLVLTIVDKWSSYTEVTNCGPYTWDKTGTTYNKSGMKFYKGTAADGCPIRDTLVLTITDRIHSYTEVTNCGPYTWDKTGATYNKSGMKFYKGTSAEGCPIRDTLVLTVVDKWSSYTEVTNCGPYTWDKTGQTYNKSGLKFYKGTAEDGCPIRDTLVLTVVDKWSSYTEVTNCGPYTWDKTGQTYNKSGLKFYKGTAEDGCPIRDTLDLTIISCKGHGDIVEPQLSTLNSITIYPNPTTGRVQLNVTEADRIEVLDLVGRRVALFENTNTLDLSGLADGTYTLRVTMPEGVVLRKVVKR